MVFYNRQTRIANFKIDTDVRPAATRAECDRPCAPEILDTLNRMVCGEEVHKNCIG